MVLAMVSTKPPGANATNMRMGLSGHWAWAFMCSTKVPKAKANHFKHVVHIGMSPNKNNLDLIVPLLRMGRIGICP
jgi:hypothetical protein